MAEIENAISILEDDHERIQELLDQLEQTTERATKTRTELVVQVAAEIRTHAELEELIFYPAYREAVKDKEDRAMYFEAVEEHHVVHLLLPELESTDVSSEEFGAKAMVLKEILEHHIQDEEAHMFPSARKAMAKAELVELGQTMAQRKTELMAAVR
jgi:hemerythrin-like domain-containing protein